MSDKRSGTLFNMEALSRYPNVVVRESTRKNANPAPDHAKSGQNPEWMQQVYEKAYDEGWNACMEKLAEKEEELKSELEQEKQVLQEQAENEEQQLQQQLALVSEQLPQALDAYLAKLEKQVREQVCDLALVLAGEIINIEVQRGDAIKHVVSDLLQESGGVRQGELLVHPDHVELLSKQGLPDGIKISGDASLEPGDAMFEFNRGVLDGRVKERLSLLRERLTEQEEYNA